MIKKQTFAREGSIPIPTCRASVLTSPNCTSVLVYLGILLFLCNRPEKRLGPIACFQMRMWHSRVPRYRDLSVVTLL